ncbi:MAG: hypothetical protein E7591_00915 [Ruminococcaceae bacterium]|nr:hypothetical protein [Oscillospiraceae bacterium]
MKANDIIKDVDLQRAGHELSSGTLCSYIAELEERIYTELVCTHKNPDNIEYTAISEDTTLIAPARYKDMYVFYVLAKIDYIRQDTSRYTNNMIMYNELYSDFANWWNRTYLPNQKYKMEW